VDPVAAIRHAEGRDLFDSSSYAVWVGPREAKAKYVRSVEEADSPIDPAIQQEALYITGNYLIIECHLQSTFSDMQIAYDAMGFRQIDTYIETGEGLKIRPLQTLIGAQLEEEEMGVLRRYRRINVLVFPMRDALTGDPVINAADPHMRLVLEGHASTFTFNWEGEPIPEPLLTGTWERIQAEAVRDARIVKVGFMDLFAQLRRLAHEFD
jgi:hypothetical protein